MDKLKKAIDFATRAHFGQKRSDGTPYINHPLRVLKSLQDFVETEEDTLCSAVLHDVLEDTSTDNRILIREFGQNVSDIVEQLTNKHPVGTTFLVKQAALLEHARKMGDAAKKIKVSDRHDNISDMGDWDLWKQRRYAKAALDLFEALSPIPLIVEPLAEKTIQRCKEILNEENKQKD